MSAVFGAMIDVIHAVRSAKGRCTEADLRAHGFSARMIATYAADARAVLASERCQHQDAHIAAAIKTPSIQNLVRAADALLKDVRRRHPGERLRCRYMIALDRALQPFARRRP